jgi:hypothetical protein
VKVIARGVPPDPFVYWVSCCKCAAGLEVARGDIKGRFDHDASGTRRIYVYYIVCPLCTAVTDLDPKAITTS